MIDGSRWRTKGSQAGGSAPAPAPESLDALLADGDAAALEQERDFLLGSLRDLEAEHGAGDIGDVDYDSLRDDYTARAAAVLRALDRSAAGAEARRGNPARRRPDRSGRRPSRSPIPCWRRPERSRRRWRSAAIVAAIVVVGVLAAWAVTASSGSRLPNQPVTGTFAGSGTPGASNAAGSTAAGASPATAAAATVDPRLTQAGQLVQKGKITDALKLYDQVLKDRPNDPEALASEGWLIAQAGMAANRTDLIDQGLAKIQTAEKVDAIFPTAHFFRGVLLLQAKGDPAGAVTELREYLGLVSPSAPEVPQVEKLLQTAITAAGPNVPPGPNAPPTSAP